MDVSTTQSSGSLIARRTRGQTHGPITRLMSPSVGEPGRTRGFQLWIAMPPDRELGPSESIYQAKLTSKGHSRLQRRSSR
jgi:hypothetical protein